MISAAGVKALWVKHLQTFGNCALISCLHGLKYTAHLPQSPEYIQITLSKEVHPIHCRCFALLSRTQKICKSLGRTVLFCVRDGSKEVSAVRGKEGERLEKKDIWRWEWGSTVRALW